MRRRSVLIVDDNPLIRGAIGEAFTREMDFSICGEAHNGQDAIEKARLLRPALVIMDVCMPVLNGLDATRILKKWLPDIPVIIYPLYGTTAIKDEALRAGAVAVVCKTDAIGALIGKARQLLEQRAAA